MVKKKNPNKPESEVRFLQIEANEAMLKSDCSFIDFSCSFFAVIFFPPVDLVEYAKLSSTLWHMLSFSSPFIYQQKEPESSSLENKVRAVLDLSSSEVRF